MMRRSNVLDDTSDCIDIVNDGSSHYSSAEFSSKTSFASTVEASTNIEGGNVAVSVEASASFKTASSGSTSSTGIEFSYVSSVMSEPSVHIYGVLRPCRDITTDRTSVYLACSIFLLLL